MKGLGPKKMRHIDFKARPFHGQAGSAPRAGRVGSTGRPGRLHGQAGSAPRAGRVGSTARPGRPGLPGVALLIGGVERDKEGPQQVGEQGSLVVTEGGQQGLLPVEQVGEGGVDDGPAAL